jgi:PleD family two-component response regulator
MEDREDAFICEYRLRNQSSQFKWLMDKGKIVNRGSNGEPIRATGTLHDITSRKQLEEERTKLIHELEKISITDPLTGSNNRRYFNEAARKLFKLSSRHRRPFSAAMLDIDYFKKVNDTSGHDIGDEALYEAKQKGRNCVVTKN